MKKKKTNISTKKIKLTDLSKKKMLLMGLVSLFVIAIISLGTYAIWNSELLTGDNTIKSGQIKMSYTETNEITMENALPMKDEEGKVLEKYFDFQVLSYIKTRDNDSTQRKLSYDVILEPITVDNPLNDNEIKVYLTKVDNGNETVVVEPTTIDELTDYILKSQEEIFSNNKAEVITSYRLRVWIDESVDTSKFNENKYRYKFRVNVNSGIEPVKGLTATEFAQANVGTNGLELVTHEIDETLQVDSRFAAEYRYRGGNSVVNNYVTFNNEIWRIIGIIPTEDTDDNVENRFKIIKDKYIENIAWNENASNNWTTSTLNTYLNNDYYNTLTSDAQNMIGTTKYYLGGNGNANTTKDIIWRYERKNESNKSGYYYGTNPVMQNDESKKIALMYASDYGYAPTNSCWKNLSNYDESSNCKTTNNWLDNSQNTWFLSQVSSNSNNALFVSTNGSLFNTGLTAYGYAIRPTLTLSSNVKISGGSGTSSEPYILSVK